MFGDALSALAELLGVENDDGADERRVVTVSAHDRPALLAAWLEELVYLAESEGFVATGLDALTLDEDRVAGTISGFLGDPPPLVKAVTWHRLQFEPAAGGYSATVVLDV